MDGIKIGDRFKPLPNSPRHGPKRWRQAPLRPKDIADGIGRLFVEIELTPVDRLQAELGGVDTFEASPAVTEADAIAEPAMKAYIGGRAVFPPRARHISGTSNAHQQEQEWQERAVVMHAAQVPTILEAKPTDDSTKGLYFSELKRGD